MGDGRALVALTTIRSAYEVLQDSPAGEAASAQELLPAVGWLSPDFEPRTRRPARHVAGTADGVSPADLRIGHPRGDAPIIESKTQRVEAGFRPHGPADHFEVEPFAQGSVQVLGTSRRPRMDYDSEHPTMDDARTQGDPA